METFFIQVPIQAKFRDILKKTHRKIPGLRVISSMKLQILWTFIFLFNLQVVVAKAHDYDQIPLDYVKFPQPIYRGSGEGKLLRPCVSTRVFDAFLSNGRRNILGYYYLCPTSMGSMSYERTQYPFRYCFHWCAIRKSSIS